ncbi:starch phosphorylase [Sporobacter termitidis DSM 10068]|uniref:Alpha-1,4 glucan phosphorylase n=1 Tax=Sporobacter termitidis DSM 10068 TaxID=1123282 RepID=A0A1M5YND7_9FIRM|nr:glycogen/starch/alpha-glucan phosphorylase [Sporobacter termitidis]SHI13512.1 starch phosphorylase [Sporobacter termitidis DSM 10068]
MFVGKEDFLLEFYAEVAELFGKPLKFCSTYEIYEALVRLISGKAAIISTETRQRNVKNNEKEVFYFSMEFLIGRLLKNYLLNLDIEDIVRDAMTELGHNMEALYQCERDPGLGNGGLGRLAACFLDSMTFLSVPGMGMGIRYRFGLFKQRLVDGWQTEEPDAWLDNGYPWETPKSDAAVTVKFGGVVDKNYTDGKMSFVYRDYDVVNALPYDVPVVGYGGRTVNTLRLWRALPLHEVFDLNAFNRGEYSAAVKHRNDIEAISTVLYPDDSTPAGKELRLKQEYFFVAAGVGSILKSFKARYGADKLGALPDRVCIHINDTHPALCAPELMRLLLDEEHLEWDEAWSITTRTIAYTNHTVMPEALERWPIDLFRQLLPRIYMIVEEIDRRFRESADRSKPNWHDAMKATAILWDGQVHMANLSVISCFSVNGVSDIHTEILKNETLRDFYALMPQKFSNKTNGVSHRRFLHESNPGLSALISESIGRRWLENAAELSKLAAFKDDAAFLSRLGQVKRENKARLSDFIRRNTAIAVDPDSVFDIQVKRIHAYKRQLLFAFKIMNTYNALKENPKLDVKPHTFIAAGKAAQSYVFAKETIKFICAIADVVNSDPDVCDKMKVVFIENFNVSTAQLIYPAADISEQISTAGKEASGTGNMKFMMNGAVTLGTADGANIELRDSVGDDNIFIFGLKADEVLSYYKNGGYLSYDLVQEDSRLKLLTSQLRNGFYNGYEFNHISDALLRNNDEYFVFKDFDPYVKAWEELVKACGDAPRWAGISLMNIAGAGRFSSDRAITEYANGIWHTRCDIC